MSFSYTSFEDAEATKAIVSTAVLHSAAKLSAQVARNALLAAAKTEVKAAEAAVHISAKTSAMVSVEDALLAAAYTIILKLLSIQLLIQLLL